MVLQNLTPIRPSKSDTQRRTRRQIILETEQKRQQQISSEQYKSDINQYARANVFNLAAEKGNISNIDSEVNNFFLQNVDTIDPAFKSSFKISLQNSVNELKNTQQSEINKIASRIDTYREKIDKYNTKKREARDKGDFENEAYYGGLQEKYIAQRDKANDVITRLNKGELLDSASIKQTISQVGDIARRQSKIKYEKKIQPKKITFDTKKVNEVVSSLAEKYSTNAPSNTTIRKAYEKAGIKADKDLINKTFKVLLEVEKKL